MIDLANDLKPPVHVTMSVDLVADLFAAGFSPQSLWVTLNGFLCVKFLAIHVFFRCLLPFVGNGFAGSHVILVNGIDALLITKLRYHSEEEEEEEKFWNYSFYTIMKSARNDLCPLYFPSCYKGKFYH